MSAALSAQALERPAGARGAAPAFVPGANCTSVNRAERAAVLVDTEAYYRAFAQAALRAERSIVIVGWDFHSRTPLTYGELPDGAPTRLGEFLNFLVRRRRKLHVYILVWDFPMVFSQDRELPVLYRFGWRPHRRVHIRFDDTVPVIGSHHQKLVVIDDRLAFCGGIDLTQRRLDTRRHDADDPRRTAEGESYPPFHDLMLMVDGPAARSLGRLVGDRWRRSGGSRLKPSQARGDPWPRDLAPGFTHVEVAISRTMPPRGDAAAVREIEQLTFDLIGAARRTIYLENQYFTADRIAEALAARLGYADGPEIVLVLRRLSNGWLEDLTMQTRRAHLIRKLKAEDRFGKFHVYCPEVAGLEPGSCINVHSKLTIIDDAWLRIGSANLSNRSMGFDSECDLTIAANGDPRTESAIRALRLDLLAEHLAATPAEVEEALDRHGSMAPAIASLAKPERHLAELAIDEVPEVLGEAMRVGDPESPVSLQRMLDFFAPDTRERPPRARWLPFLIGALAIAGLAALWRYTPLQQIASPDRITVWATEFAHQWWAPLVILGGYTAAATIMFPRPLITLFAVVAFGAWLGFAYAMGGVLIATLATYAAGRLLDRETVRRLAGPRLVRLNEVLRKRGLVKMTAVRLVPLAPFAVIGLVAGALRISLFDYTAGTLLGMLPGTLAATVFGDQLRNVLGSGNGINFWLIAGAMMFVVVLTITVRRWLLREDQPVAINDRRSP